MPNQANGNQMATTDRQARQIVSDALQSFIDRNDETSGLALTYLQHVIGTTPLDAVLNVIWSNSGPVTSYATQFRAEIERRGVHLA